MEGVTTPSEHTAPASAPAWGAWPSPLDARSVARSSPRLEGACFAGPARDEIWWGESLPDEGGRIAVRARSADGDVRTLLPTPWNARSRVHEYGGGAWAAHEDLLVFVEKTDQRVYALAPGSAPTALTAEDPDVRFGGLSVQRGRLLAVRETLGAPVRRDIVEIPWNGDAGTPPTVLATGSDFVAHPALSPDGARIAWIAWNHPDMPWDRAEVRVAEIRVPGNEGRAIAGGGSSPVQPVWLDDDTLLYSDDPDGRWNLWRHDLRTGTRISVAPADADTGGPLWVLGTRWFRPLDDGRIVAVRTRGSDEIVLLSPDGGARRLPVDVTATAAIEDAAGARVLVSGTTAHGMPALRLVDVDVDKPEDVVRIAGDVPPWPAAFTPTAREVTVDGPHGPVHAFDFPPTNPDVPVPARDRADASTASPYVVFVHGGPTAHVGGAASGKIAYLTSRGIGVLDVNYGGSTGYGRPYRERLRGAWGIVDVDDIVAVVSALAAEGRLDPDRVAIAGGSAGGWTVLRAVTGTDVFAAGISRYGVADLRLLAAETEDFESRYLDGLVGPLPEAEARYVELSPLTRPEDFRTPLLIEQGSEDAVVPPSQSEAVRDALTAAGVPHAYLLFDGEGHGFRRAETIERALEAELAFLGLVFGFTPPGIPPLTLD